MRSIILVCAAALTALGAAEYGDRLLGEPDCAPATPGERANVFHLYGVGESTMQGEPYAGLSPPLLVIRSFDGRLAGRRIALRNLARRGQSIFPQAVALERALLCRDSAVPGVVLIYSGNNDSGRPDRYPPIGLFLERIASRSVLLRDILFLAEERFPRFRHRTLQSYEHHLRRAVELSLRSGLVPILSTAISNVSDMDPGLPAFGRRRPDPARARRILQDGEALETRGEFAKALAHYGRREGEPRMRAYLTFKMGKCLQALGRHGPAKRLLWAAVNMGARDNYGRATTSQADVVRRLAREYHLPLVDAVAIFEAASPHGVTGNELFADGVHPNLTGLRLLAQAYVDRIATLRREPARHPVPAPVEIFRALRYSRRRQTEAFLDSGRWLFSVSTGHLWPGLRLRAAAERFERARSLDPRSFSAGFGLCLVRAAADGDFLTRQENVRWLAASRLFFGAEYRLSHDDLVGVLQRLRARGVPEPMLQRAARLHARRGGR